MPVYQDKKSKLWYFRCYITDLNGTRKQRQKNGFISKRDAQAAEREFLNQENNVNDSILFSELWEKFDDNAKAKQKKQSYRKTISKFKNHILPYFSNYKVNEINASIYTKWQIKMEEKGFSYKYLSSIHVSMVTILNYAIKFYGLKYNIASQVGNFSKKNIKPKRIDFWTYQEFMKFINKVDNLVYKAFFMTLYFTGLRQGECLALKWKDINNKTIDVYKTIAKEKENGKYIINTPKTKGSTRQVTLHEDVIKCLNGLKEYYKNMIDFNDDWFVFGGLKPLAPTTIGRKRDMYCKKSGVKKIRIHDFRHSHASLLISKGVPITMVSKRLGHSNIEMTFNTYAHLIPEDEDKAINALENLSSIY